MKLTSIERQLLGWWAGHDGDLPLDVASGSLGIVSDSLVDPEQSRKEYDDAYRRLRKLALVEAEEVLEVALTDRGRRAVHDLDLPVHKLLKSLNRLMPDNPQEGRVTGRGLTLSDLIQHGGLRSDDIETSDLDYAKKRGWITLGENQTLFPTRDGRSILDKPELDALLRLVQEIAQAGLAAPGTYIVPVKTGARFQQVSYLRKMGLVRTQQRPVRIRLAAEGRRALLKTLLDAEHLDDTQLIDERRLLQAFQEPLSTPKKVLTSDDLAEELFRHVDYALAPIDVKAPVKPYKQVGRLATTTQQLSRVRKAFAQLGFEEARMTPVEYGLWNFDVLLFPPDHPERQTDHAIYLANGDIGKGAHPELYSRVQEMWKKRQFGYLSPSQINRRLLRTHSTPALIKQLQGASGEQRRFVIGHTFAQERCETLSFHAEGIILSRDTSLLILIDTLKELIKRLGVQVNEEPLVKSAYFSYTMPSIVVMDQMSGDRLAAGGMVRPEILTMLGYDVNHYLAGAFALFFHADE